MMMGWKMGVIELFGYFFTYCTRSNLHSRCRHCRRFIKETDRSILIVQNTSPSKQQQRQQRRQRSWSSIHHSKEEEIPWLVEIKYVLFWKK